MLRAAALVITARDILVPGASGKMDGGRVGILASIEEASLTIPIVARLAQIARERSLSNDPAAAFTATTHLGIFVVLHRLAEDLEYER